MTASHRRLAFWVVPTIALGVLLVLLFRPRPKTELSPFHS